MGRRFRFPLFLGCVLVGFVLVLSAQSHPANPRGRLPRTYRLSGLISNEQEQVSRQRLRATELRREVDALLKETGTSNNDNTDLTKEGDLVGMSEVTGPGLRIVLKDSLLSAAPSGNVNDLVIHSEDIRAVVNALWRSGAEAISINNQRLVSTSAVLCVGNTLLLNGTVHSPPYILLAAGADKDLFESDELIKTLRIAAEEFSLGFSVQEKSTLTVPKFTSSTSLTYARPVGVR